MGGNLDASYGFGETAGGQETQAKVGFGLRGGYDP